MKRDNPGHFTGAASEHFAASWFLRSGQQVYWPAVQQDAADFVASTPDGLKKVQVKTATWNRASPPWAYLQCRTRPTNTYQHYKPSELYDLMVVVDPSFKRLWCIPSLLITSSNLCLDGTHPNRKRSVWADYEHSL
ncbi:group I intron-associated PD-(D/E)XK endonuclease [Caballeronia sp. LZ032]|uniref:group I intron-associated PD-(D/E)XK endonuclease n=1 Tax=Caballeronia sp. LZ032 TaxID=3038565 RepID=UPI00285F6668|nr:group I intron-associated PD-(D/E)XK endonuclease [Caballeronia sp. LZ032]MDR5879032.1 group I intron-associated PD-(D/E)XK endonuclease [Caballeronia sp. LZ032]